MADRVTVGTLDELQRTGCLTGKAGAQPICVFWSDGGAFALDDRCPHMGFPLHRGTVESGLVTCHWHNARFDLCSGGTLDPWADDVRAYPVEIDDGRVTVVVEPDRDRTGHLLHRLEEGLEQGITLVMAKAVLGLLDGGVPASDIVRAGVDFGARYRQAGWGAGLTVLTAMANVLPHLDPADQGLALVHGLAFVSRDTRGRPPRFPLLPLGGAVPAERLDAWYRRFVETRSADAAERTLASAITGVDAAAVADVMFSAVTDHVFIDGGHTIDFTNKAFEVLDHLGWRVAPDVLPTLVAQTAAASRSEEQGSWRYPHDLAGMIRAATAALDERLAAGARNGGFDHDRGVAELAWAILVRGPGRDRGRHRRRDLDRRRPGGARPRGRVRRRVADHPLPHAERPRRLGRGAPRLHGRQRPPSGGPARPDAGTPTRRLPRRAADLPRPLPERPRRPAAYSFP